MTFRLAWATDIHLNFPPSDIQQEFFAQIKATGAEAVLVTGDISEGDRIVRHLKDMQNGVAMPFYFVLGNHDFYQSSVAAVRKSVREACASHRDLHYLREDVVKLTDTWGLVGVDGWADAKVGKPEANNVILADWSWIDDYKREQAHKDVYARMRVAELNGYIEASLLRNRLEEAVERFPKILVATHVPPFWESTWHRGQHSDHDFAPWFCCKQVGDVLRTFAKKYPKIEFKVLCGHTHGGGIYQHADNMVVITGEAHYSYPNVNEVFDLL